MLIAVVTNKATVEVRLVASESGESAEDGHSSSEPLKCEDPKTDAQGQPYCGEGPSPILPEGKEVGWAAGSFGILFIVMVAFLVPKVRKGMAARYDHIQGEREEADSMRAAARADVAQYESSLATVKAEANERVEAARAQLEAERSAKLAEVNAAISARRDAANAETLAAREAVRGQVADAVADVTARTLELTLGKQPDAAKVRTAVDGVMSAGVTS